MSGDGFSGDGGAPPPPGSGGGGFSKNDAMYGFDETITKETKGERKSYPRRVKLWYLPPSAKDKPCTVLDRKGDRYTVLIHEFVGPDGKTKPKCMVRCIAKRDLEKGCPLCEALGQEGRWFWALTGIDGSKFSPTKGQNAGNVYTNFRRLILITSQHYEYMRDIEGKGGKGWRGRQFDVSRDMDTKSPRIGNNWYPNGKVLTDEDMLREFEEAAATYGLPVERYIEPFAYDQVLKAPTYEEAAQIAAAIKGTSAGGVTVPEGDAEAIEF